jgi:uncharacterized protein (UPF0264 family)
LVSVRDAEEAEAAVKGGADIIDVKEPKQGPLGMAKLDTIREVIDRVGGRRPISVALGELRNDPPISHLPAGIAYAKIGLSGQGDGWQKRLAEAFAALPPQVKAVAVAYFNPSQRAYPPTVPDIVEWAIQHRIPIVLFDTYMKDRGNLFDRRRILAHAGLENHLNLRLVTDSVRDVQAAGLKIALAGSLAGDAFAMAVSLTPDIVGVRGAVCDNRERGGRLQSWRVRELADLIASYNTSAG